MGWKKWFEKVVLEKGEKEVLDADGGDKGSSGTSAHADTTLHFISMAGVASCLWLSSNWIVPFIGGWIMQWVCNIGTVYVCTFYMDRMLHHWPGAWPDHKLDQNGATSGFEMCFGSQHLGGKTSRIQHKEV